MGGNNPEEKDWQGNQGGCLQNRSSDRMGDFLLENPESSFADNSRNPERKGDFFLRENYG
jgi:hypothetical protein